MYLLKYILLTILLFFYLRKTLNVGFCVFLHCGFASFTPKHLFLFVCRCMRGAENSGKESACVYEREEPR